eukprot:Pgem_evm1s10919
MFYDDKITEKHDITSEEIIKTLYCFTANWKESDWDKLLGWTRIWTSVEQIGLRIETRPNQGSAR